MDAHDERLIESFMKMFDLSDDEESSNFARRFVGNTIWAVATDFVSGVVEKKLHAEGKALSEFGKSCLVEFVMDDLVACLKTKSKEPAGYFAPAQSLLEIK